MKKLSILWLMVSVVLLVALACAPKATSPAPTAAAPVPAAPVTKAPASIPADAEWAKVVEAAKKEGKVTAYSSFLGSAAVTGPVATAFKTQYGIDLEVIGVLGAMALERVKSEHAGQKYVTDTIDGQPSVLLRAKEDGMLVPLADLPALQEKDKWATSPIFDPEGFIISMTPGVLTPYVNTSMVKAGDEPKSFTDFLDAKWKGRKIIVSPPRNTSGMYYIYLLLVRNNTFTDDYFSKLGKQEFLLTPNLVDSYAALARGDAPLHFGASISFTASLYAKGAPIKPLAMKEGAAYNQSNAISVLAKAPHPNAAKLFVNWLASQGGQEVFHKAAANMSFRKDVPDFTASALQVEPKKVFTITFELTQEIDRLTRLNYLDKLWGLE